MTTLEQLLKRFSDLNSAGSIKTANSLIPDIIRAAVAEATGKSIAPASSNGTELVVDPMSLLSEQDQEAYVEAMFRKHGGERNGASYTGAEERVQFFLAKLNETVADACKPCAVQKDGGSQITTALEKDSPPKGTPKAKAGAKRANPPKRPAK